MNKKTFFKSIFNFGSGIFLGRLTGLLRDFLIIYSFGLGVEADFILVWITVPDMLIGLFLSGGLVNYIVPKIQSMGTELQKKFVSKMTALLFFSGSVITVILLYYKEFLFKFLWPNYFQSTFYDAFNYSHWEYILIVLPIMCTLPLFRSFLQVKQKFRILGVESLIFNLLIIFSFTFLPDFKKFLIVFLFSFILRALWLVYFSIKAMERSSVPVSLVEPKSKTLNKYKYNYNLALSMGFQLILTSFPLVCRSIINLLGEGYVARYVLASRFVDFTLVLTTSVLGTVVFSNLKTRLNQNQNFSVFNKSILDISYLLVGSFIGFLFLIFTQYNFIVLPYIEAYFDTNSLTLLAFFLISVPFRIHMYFSNLVLISLNNYIGPFLFAFMSSVLAYSLFYKFKGSLTLEKYLFVYIEVYC